MRTLRREVEGKTRKDRGSLQNKEMEQGGKEGETEEARDNLRGRRCGTNKVCRARMLQGYCNNEQRGGTFKGERERERKIGSTRECIHRAGKLWGQLSPGDNSYCCNKVAPPPSRGANCSPKAVRACYRSDTVPRSPHPLRRANTVCTPRRGVCVPWPYVARTRPVNRHEHQELLAIVVNISFCSITAYHASTIGAIVAMAWRV